MKALVIYEGKAKIGTYYPPKRWRDIKKELKRGKNISLNINYGYTYELFKNKDIIGLRETKEDIERDFPQYFI